MSMEARDTNQKLATWRSIRAAATALVEEHGFTAVTVDDIAAAAGISRRTFFNYFPTKASVLFDPDPSVAAHLTAALAASPLSDDPWTALRSIFRAFVVEDYSEALPVRRRLMSERPELVAYQRDMHQYIEVALEHWSRRRFPDDTLHAQLLARSATAALTAAFLAWSPDLGPADLADLVDRAFAGVTVHLP